MDEESKGDLVPQPEYSPETVETPHEGNFFKQYFHFSMKQTTAHMGFGFFALVAVAVIVFAGLFLRENLRVAEPQEFSQAYAFVNEKISQSAAIVLSLPENVTKQEAERGITFEPSIEGEWTPTEEEGKVVYSPAKDLELGTYYAVRLETDGLQVSSDFLVDENPHIEAVFPNEGSEAHEDSEITIVFNRPMVPLTTLTELENKTLPITITPETPGKFKWISTRNLQFIPEDDLIRSSNYTVRIDEGLTSLDGLSVKGQEHSFKTRPLRYTNLDAGTLGYSKPIAIRFNQPVDLERTSREIEVTKNGEGLRGKADIDVEYGTKRIYDRKKKEYEEYIDRSVLFIYQKEDRHGRKHLWDFKTQYQLRIAKAYPLEGDINLNESRTTTLSVQDIIVSVSASSDRSSDVTPEMFDPQGELHVTFAEEVNLGKSKITAKGLESIRYKEDCKRNERGYAIYKGETCEKVDVKDTLILSFEDDAFSLSEKVNIQFERIVNTEGLTLNQSTILQTITIYPALVVYKTKPVDNESSASLTELKVCTNTPLKGYDSDNYKEFFDVDGHLAFGRWNGSWKVPPGSTYAYCSSGQFESTVRYGLTPETDYKMTLHIEDDFGQKVEKSMSFRTTIPDSKDLRFYNMQKSYNVTPEGRTKLTYAVENFDYVDVHICKVSAEEMMRTREKGGSANCQKVKETKVDLPKRYWVNNYFQVNVADHFEDTLGHYIIRITNPNYKNWNGTLRTEYTYLSVTNLAVAEKKLGWDDDRMERGDDSMVLEGNSLYWIVNSTSLNPAVGASVSVYSRENYNSSFVYEETVAAGADGIAIMPVIDESAAAIVRHLNDSAIVSEGYDRLQYAWSGNETGMTYLYTDRPIYRPGQEVFVRGIDRITYDGEFELTTEQRPRLIVTDSRGGEVYNQELEQTEFGTFSAQFVLPTDAPLGNYRIRAFEQSYTFSVEEYVPSAFRVDVTGNQEEFIAGDTLDLTVDANYYFGVPLDGGEVTYSVTSQDYYFDRYTNEYFNFGRGWYYCYWCGYGDDYLFRGETVLDENGKAQISEILDFETFYSDAENEKSKIFNVNVTVKDNAGRSVSSQKSFIVHRGEVYLGVKTDKRFGPKDEDIEIKVKSVDTEGKEVSAKDITLLVEKITWNTFKRREVDGGFYYKSEEVREEVLRKEISTNRNGNYDTDISFDEEGSYEITVRKVDSLGNVIKATSNLYIYGEKQVSVRPTNNHSLEIETDTLSVSVGDTPEILVKSPFDKSKALITVERGKIFEYWIVDPSSNLFTQKIPIKEGYSPNVYVSVLLLSDDPEIKFGQLEFGVDTQRRSLAIEVSSNKKEYLPGEEVTLDITTTNYLNQPVDAEVSVAVADLSVLALKGNPKKNPLGYFNPGLPLHISTASNIKNVLYEMDIPLGTKGGGGGNPDDLAKKKRGVFKDTAYWSAHVETGADGKASLSFTLPDNLTTWQIETLGVTKDTLVGVHYAEIMSRKDLMLTPLMPRFVVPGDEFGLGAKIFNQTDKKQKIEIALESDTLEFIEEPRANITLDAKSTETIRFRVKASSTMEKGVHIFTLSAQNDEYADIVENTIAITPNDTYEAVATANFSRSDEEREYVYIPDNVLPLKGGLTVNANATMAVFLSDALNYLVSYPYGCSEQLASKLASIAVVKRGLNLENVGDKFQLDDITFEGRTYSVDEAVRLGLARIYQSQRYDGGFSYYPTLESNFYLTLHILQALNELKEAGFSVSEDTLQRASRFLYGKITADARYNRNNDAAIITTYALTQAGTLSVPEMRVLQNKIVSIADNKLYLNETIQSVTLAQLAILTAKDYPRNLKNEVFDTLENRLTVDGRGAYLKSRQGERLWEYYETPIKNTSLFLKALTAHENEHELTDKVLRYLLKSRKKDGAWGSTNNTLAAIDAMTDYLAWQRETESDYLLEVDLEGDKILTADVNAETVLDTFTTHVPIDAFERNTTETITLTRTNRNNLNNNYYYDMSLKYFLPANMIPPRDEGITVTRELYTLDDEDEKNPVTSAVVGEVLRGKITITFPKHYNYISVEDFIPAGFEIVNLNLSTEDQSLTLGQNEGEYFAAETGESTQKASVWDSIKDFVKPEDQGAEVAGRYYDEMQFADEWRPANRKLRVSHEELHDDRVFLFSESVSKGVYEYEYFVRALTPGEFQHLPAVVSQMYFPEVFGRTSGNYFIITE